MGNLIQRLYFGIVYTSVSPPPKLESNVDFKKMKKKKLILLIDAILSWSIGDTVERILIFLKKKFLKKNVNSNRMKEC